MKTIKKEVVSSITTDRKEYRRISLYVDAQIKKTKAAIKIIIGII